MGGRRLGEWWVSVPSWTVGDGFWVGRRVIAACCALLACTGLAACADSTEGQRPGARVTRVIDGDTVEMERLGRVRLIGVDAPEQGRCYENAATRFTRDRLEGQVVQYELGVERRDRYDRTLAYLTRDGDMHNRALLSEGYATVLTIPPNDKYESTFEKAEREAKAKDAGFWFRCDRNRLAARRAAARRRKAAKQARRVAALERRAERRARRAARARRDARRVAARRRERRAEEGAGRSPERRRGGGGGSCLPSSACPGKRDGDGDGCYCE